MRSAIERDGGVNAAKAKLSSGIIDHRWHHEVGRVHTVLVPPPHKEFVQLERQLRPLLSLDVTDVAKQFFLRMVTIYRFQGALHLRDKECQQLSKLQNRGTSKGWKRNRE